jgi:hypothetical protein
VSADGNTMTVNNVCSVLIVYGSYAPGGEKHRIFSGLPGEWKKGKILCDLISPPDGIAPGEVDEVEAWTLKFSDCQAELFTPEWDIEKKLLYQRWTALDRAMGAGWARDQRRWWPEESDPVVGNNGMIVVNIYVPLKYFPYLKDREDVPSPDEEDDLHGLWKQVKGRRKRYASSLFIALIKDATPDEYGELFGDLPGGEELIKKLQRFYQEHRKGSGNLLWDGKSEYFSMYVSPLKEYALPGSDLMDLVKADIASRAALLRTAVFHEEAASLDALAFAFGKPQPADYFDSPAADALTHASDIILGSPVVDDHWIYCLKEACYGIAASRGLADWLMSHWYGLHVDCEAAYGIWKADGRYEIVGDTCHVFRTSSEI